MWRWLLRLMGAIADLQLELTSLSSSRLADNDGARKTEVKARLAEAETLV
jgi:hypothetical protein